MVPGLAIFRWTGPQSYTFRQQISGREMDGRGLALAMLATCVTLCAGEAKAIEQKSSDYWVILVPGDTHREDRHEDYYQMAVYRLPGDTEVSRFAQLSSLCVSHTLVGQLVHARHHCDEALAETRAASNGDSPEATALATQLALAYSNRGVLRARSADSEGAERDFRTAIELKPATRIPSHNLARLLQPEAPG